ncbi:MAG: hypoxanthine phosphoribosyltransferase [Spirochaetes bacterium]|nr:hypoxanthine phosphoribosyltransferase [Spirochaetota bacterium]
MRYSNAGWWSEVEKIATIVTKDEIQRKVAELGSLISVDYKDRDVVLVCNLKGAFIFLADLCRHITARISIDFIATTSYKGTRSTGTVRIIKDLKLDVRGKHILLVEDIVDTGYTLDYTMKYLALHGPESIRVCTLLDKRCKREIDVNIDYIGFEVSDRFVIGYGLDYDERFRELDYIGEIIQEEN